MWVWVKPRFAGKYIIGLTMLAVLGWSFVDMSRSTERHSFYSKQVEAAQLMREAMDLIFEYRMSLDLPWDSSTDPNMTGIIGQEFTGMTTSRGLLESKRTATNPDFAALMVKYFSELNLRPGDYIAVGASGSFPSLTLAALSAAKVWELQPILIYSLGASMYGANEPNFTFLEMLDYLNAVGIMDYEVAAISPGGNHDQAPGFWGAEESVILELIEDYDLPKIIEGDLVSSINKRMDIYSQQDIKVFINVGGGSANYGDTVHSLRLPAGLVSDYSDIPDHPLRGLVFEYLSMDLPVVNLINVRNLASDSGIAIDSVPFEQPGISSVYYTTTYSYSIVIIVLCLICGTLVWMSCQRKRN